MLLEMSMRMGSKHVNDEVRHLASRRANRQQQRILVQISVVACLFYFYMATYYLLYHVFDIENKWVVLFNSFFYSVTHSMNPLIYFSLNKEMRAQLIKALTDFLSAICCIEMKLFDDADSQRKASTDPRSSTKGAENSITETSPLFNANLINNNNGRTALLISTNAGVEKLRISEFSASLKRLVNHNNTATLTLNMSSTTDEFVNSNTNDEHSRGSRRNSHKIDLKGPSNGNLPNGKQHEDRFSGHKNSGYIDEPNSLGRLTTDESEEDSRLLAESEQSETQQSLLKSIVKAMQRVILFDIQNGANRTSHSQSLDQIARRKQRSMKLSRTIHAFSEFSRSAIADQKVSKSHSFTNEMALEESEDSRTDELSSCEKLLRDSLVLLINEADTNPTIATAQELESFQSKYNTPCTPEDDIIFL